VVLTSGAEASAYGRVVAVPQGMCFEPPMWASLVHYPPGAEPAPRPSGRGVPVGGVDLDRLEGRREKDGAVEGWATLTGIWQDTGLQVRRQQPGGAAPERRSPVWTVPPCSPPLGGWPAQATPNTSEFESVLLELSSTGAIVQRTMFSPPDAAQVLVLAPVFR